MSEWLGTQDLADLLGVDRTAIQKRFEAGTLSDIGVEWRPHPTRSGWRQYRVSETESHAGRNISSAGEQVEEDLSHMGEILEDLEADAGLTGWIERERYVYDADRDRYIVMLPSESRPFVRAGEWIRSVWRLYTGGATIAEVCRRFECSRRQFTELKTALALTKTRASFTDEELLERPEDDLVEEGIRAKENRIVQRLERHEWKRTKDDAQKWRTLSKALHEWIEAVDLDHIPARVCADPHPDRGMRDLYVAAHDWHVGKRPHASPGYTLADQESELERLIERIAVRLRYDVDKPRAILVPIGQDYFHSDGMAQTTTRGTPQGSQSIGSMPQQFALGVRIAVRLLRTLADLANVHAFWSPGNHDRFASFALAQVLRSHFANDRRVVVDIQESSRRVFACGRTPVMVLHGDGDKLADRPMLLAHSLPAGCILSQGLVFGGHLHTSTEDQIRGVRVFTAPSPSHTDDWHEVNGYTGNARACRLYEIDHQTGLRTVHEVRAPDLRVVA